MIIAKNGASNARLMIILRKLQIFPGAHIVYIGKSSLGRSFQGNLSGTKSVVGLLLNVQSIRNVNIG